MYAVHVEYIRQRHETERLIAALKGADLPTLSQALDDFDAELVAEPKVTRLDPRQAELRRLLGVA